MQPQTDSPRLDEHQAEELRQSEYNATIRELIDVTDDLRIFRIVPDQPMPTYQPGQYTSLGLGFWEKRVENVQAEHVDELHLRRVAKRAYSVSCTMLDQDRIVRVEDCDYLEFYVALVRQAEKHSPTLTPRLFNLRVGDRLFMEPKFRGKYSLEDINADQTIVFFSTGTGEAPHNAMVAELLHNGHQGPIIAATCVRWRSDLAYLPTQRQLQQRFPNYQYLWLTTREPENLDPSHPHFVGRRYLQTLVGSGDFERQTGVTLDPASTRVFLCGNPTMIGVPIKHQPKGPRVPQPGGMIDILTQRGFRADTPRNPGNIHFERYW